MSLFEAFQNVLQSFGMENVTHPLFYNSKIAIRFNIGDNGNDVYVDLRDEDSTVNPEYVNACFERVTQIYNRLKNKPDLLVIDGYICENETSENFVSSVKSTTGLPEPHEKKCEKVCKDEDVFTHIFLCWKLKDFHPDKLFREIILADFGSGNHFLTSSVYFVCTNDNVLFHLYDDRGADLISDKKETICYIYEELNHLILDYDREKIDATFKT